MNKIHQLSVAVGIEAELLNEVQINSDIAQMVTEPSVKKYISLNKKKLIGKKLTQFERNKEITLLDDPKVQEYLKASEKVGQRIGWFQGSILGGLSGGAMTASALSTTVAGPALAALVLLGAVAGGISTGYPMSKLRGIFRRWKTEEKITQGGLKAGAIIGL